jgi:chloramphenicol 3-O phosphotransferase
MLIGIDDFLSKVPAAWLDLGYDTGPGANARDGLWFESTSDGPTLRVGRVGREVLSVYHRTVADAVRAGFDVIVDDLVIDQRTLDSWRDALGDLETNWIAVRCPTSVAMDRERARGDRPIGMVQAQTGRIDHNIAYACEVDTSALTPDAATAALVAALETIGVLAKSA